MDSARNSSMGTKVRKEIRPITDSSFKSQCVDKILDFLVSRSYEQLVQRRTLLTPSTKDFANIFSVCVLDLLFTFVLFDFFFSLSVCCGYCDWVLIFSALYPLISKNLDISKITYERRFIIMIWILIFFYIYFQFIYRHLDGQYNLPNRFEEEIPRLLKLLKYPVQMSKSSFITGVLIFFYFCLYR